MFWSISDDQRSDLMNSRINPQNLAYWFFLVCFCFSSLDSKAAGLAWLSLLFVGIASVVRQSFAGSTFKNKKEDDLKLWFILTVIALLLKAVPALYWRDSWAERHAEIRLVLGAFAAYAICRWGSFNKSKHQVMVGAASISCAWALLLMLVDVREAAPTNPIPWAAAIAVLSAWLLPMACSNQFTRAGRWVFGLGSLMGFLAVLISENRGAYGLVIVWPVVLLGHSNILDRMRELKVQSVVTRLAVGVLVVVIAGIFLTQTAVVQRPLHRIQVAIDEIQLSHQSLEANVNGSIGARLYMWSRSVSFIQDAPWIGHGQASRKEAIAQWGKDQKSEHVQSLGHVHNEYLHSMMDYGLWGLSSLLLYAVGMFWLAFRMRSRGAFAQAWAMAGVLFIHITTGLTNVNFAHNYYPTMLSIVMSLILLTPSVQGRDLKKTQ